MADPSVERCMFCECETLTLEKDVGWDVSTAGEERQHVQKCTGCGAWRFVFETCVDWQKPEIHKSKWHESEVCGWCWP